MKGKSKNGSPKELEDKYLHYAAQLASMLGANMGTTLTNMPLEYKFKIGAIAIASLSADFCFAIINKEHPDVSKGLLDDIFKQAHIILDSRVSKLPSGTKQ